jgi:hypothetical protein
MNAVRNVRGSQSQCLRPERDRRVGGAARRRKLGSLVHDGRDLGVGVLRGEREMTGALESIGDDHGQGRVGRSPCGSVGALIDTRSEERMRELQTIPGSFDDPARDGGLERVFDSGSSQRSRISLPQRRQERERLPRSRRQRVEPSPDELV